MPTELTENEMREALGLDTYVPPAEPPTPVVQFSPATREAPIRPKRPYPALRVVLRASKEFEGEETLFTYDAKTLSTFEAELQAKKAAGKEKFRYFELVSIKPVE
ncbi:hypothetical protein [Pseudomonas fluorescens]|uniref:Uncharacterized protein n=1 Tax=Pseudomonas fluorescens TaxID=294 RepID=A0A5E7EWE1_PSEFL|nr:hypothetical protein [Pseudomonas fluorescens]VVO31004.1 hypothetical protein PS723_04991 [Pseudomonas fluorescens]